MQEEEQGVREQDTTPVQEWPRKLKVLPCGGRGCSYCHDGCRADRPAYRDDLDENQEIKKRSR
jgi:hypothetical protein